MSKSVRQCNLDYGNYVQVPLLIIKTQKLKHLSKLVYMTIVSRCIHKDYCYPSQKTLGKDVGGKHINSIKASLNELVETRLIEYADRVDGYSKMITLLPIENSALVEGDTTITSLTKLSEKERIEELQCEDLFLDIDF